MGVFNCNFNVDATVDVLRSVVFATFPVRLNGDNGCGRDVLVNPFTLRGVENDRSLEAYPLPLLLPAVLRRSEAIRVP